MLIIIHLFYLIMISFNGFLRQVSEILIVLIIANNITRVRTVIDDVNGNSMIFYSKSLKHLLFHSLKFPFRLL